MEWKVQDIESKVIKPAARYIMGRRAGPLLFLAGQIAADPERQKIIMGYQDLPEHARKLLMTGSMNTDFKEGPIASQVWYIWNNIKQMLEEQGSSLDNILYVTNYILNMDWFPTVERVRKVFFPDKPHPPSTIVEVSQLGLSPDVLIEIEVVALIPGATG